VEASFDGSGASYGSPRVYADLLAEGWTISVNTVAESMARQGLIARVKKRRKNLTRQDKSKCPFPDLVCRDFTAPAPNVKWVGDMTEIPTDEGKLYLATVIDLCSRRLLGYPTSAHPDAELAGQAITMAGATRGGTVAGVIFHRIVARPTPRTTSPPCARSSTSHSPWAGSDRALIMRPRSRSSRHWSTRCSRVTTFALEKKSEKWL